MSARPIILVGCPRSGTTLLSALLHAHPDIAVAPETRFLVWAYRNRHTFGDLRDTDSRRRLARFATRKRSLFGDLKLDRDAVVEAMTAAPPTFGSVVGTLWQEFAVDRGATRWVEKRPAYWREMPTLLRLFPDAQVIHLVRDPRSVVASLMQVPWYDRPLPHAVALWTQAERELAALGRRLPADSYHRVRYEDLAADPRGELTRLCAFLREPFDDAMLDHHTAAEDLVPLRKTWHDRVHGPVDESRTNAWERSLDARDIGLVEFGAGRALRRNGYSPSGRGTRPRLTALAQYRCRQLVIRLGIVRDRSRDAVQRRVRPVPLGAVGRDLFGDRVSSPSRTAGSP